MQCNAFGRGKNCNAFGRGKTECLSILTNWNIRIFKSYSEELQIENIWAKNCYIKASIMV